MAAKGVLVETYKRLVSTHSHPKVAALAIKRISLQYARFNTQPPEGGCLPQRENAPRYNVSTHSHPKVAALADALNGMKTGVSTHSHPKVAALIKTVNGLNVDVSTHSHPKVAASKKCLMDSAHQSFNTQPPEGGCQY